jgi:hypothetical protein
MGDIDGVRLLKWYAPGSSREPADAVRLCQKVGNNPLAIKFIGLSIQAMINREDLDFSDYQPVKAAVENINTYRIREINLNIFANYLDQEWKALDLASKVMCCDISCATKSNDDIVNMADIDHSWWEDIDRVALLMPHYSLQLYTQPLKSEVTDKLQDLWVQLEKAYWIKILGGADFWPAQIAQIALHPIIRMFLKEKELEIPALIERFIIQNEHRDNEST